MREITTNDHESHYTEINIEGIEDEAILLDEVNNELVVYGDQPRTTEDGAVVNLREQE